MKKNSQNGFTLLEILVALVVLAIGMLGLLSLQMVSLKNNHSAQMRTTAIVHTYDILDRIRLNRSVNYEIAMGAAAPTGTSMRDLDLQEWKNNLAQDLPLGDGEIDITGDMVTVTVRWDDSRAGSDRGTGTDTRGSATQEFKVSTQR